jgi:hypothetical protein
MPCASRLESADRQAAWRVALTRGDGIGNWIVLCLFERDEFRKVLISDVVARQDRRQLPPRGTRQVHTRRDFVPSLSVTHAQQHPHRDVFSSMRDFCECSVRCDVAT